PVCRLAPSCAFHSTSATSPYTLSLHDALPISGGTMTSARICVSVRDTTRMRTSRNPNSWQISRHVGIGRSHTLPDRPPLWPRCQDRKSTRLNSSHVKISYAVFSLQKKNSDVAE